MRKITSQAVHAFRNGRTFNSSNTSVSVAEGMVILRLHGNQIARYPLGNWDELEVSNGGWSSNTTKERLNGLPGVSVCQRNWVWYLNGAKWDGSWRLVHQGAEVAA